MDTHRNQFHLARKKERLTLIKLAAKADVSLPALRLIERGKYGNLTTLEKVANALNKKVTIILDKPQETHHFSEEDMKLFSDYTNWNYKYSTVNGVPCYKDKKGNRYTTDEVLQLWKSQQPKVIHYNDTSR